MDKEKTHLAAKLLGLVGILCFLAMAFQFVPLNYGIFAGIVCFVIAGFFQRLATRGA